MKIRSKLLFAFLFEFGVLNGTPEEIDCAKREYRRQYKRNWKKIKRPRKEIRIGVTLKQFAAIKAKAQECNLPYTTFCRQLILAAVEQNEPFIRNESELLKILQLVSMASIALSKNNLPLFRIKELIEEAETLLLQYLNNTIKK